MNPPQPGRLSRRKFWYYTAIIWVSCILIFVAVLLPRIAAMQNFALSIGDVAENDFIAPYSLTYESQLLTERQREVSVSEVAPVFTQQDTTIARVQLEKLRSVLTYISTVRADEYATLQQKLTDLAALDQFVLDLDTAEAILGLSETRWQIIQQEATKVLEEVMRTTVRTDRIEETRRNLSNLVSLTLPENQAEIAATLAAHFITANSVYDETLTEAARLKAAEQVQPVIQTYVAGQTIVLRGSVVTPITMEALEEFDLTGVRSYWQEVVSAVLLSLLMGGFFVVYFRRNPILLSNPRSFFTFIGLFFIFLFSARFTIPGHTVIPFIFPTMAFCLTMSALFRAELALVSVIPLSVLIAYGLPNALELILFFILSSFFGVLTLRRAQRLSSFVWSGVSIAVAGSTILFLLRLNDPATDLIGLATLVAAGVVNGTISIFLTLLLQLVAGQILGLSTPLQLIELSRPDHPLLQFILRNAPGTYQHSLQVANLAEQAAERIGADALLTRVGALYHDAGKALNPIYFIENQIAGADNPHNALDPETSASTIIQHVSEGMDLARKYHLPAAIRNFVNEHHGSQITRYQYVKAVEAAGGDEGLVDLEKFRYPGPRPQSKETALLMLADACEARLRAGRPKTDEEMRNMIVEIVQGRINSGELDDTNLTMKDLRTVVESFIETLRGVYHPRIEYPALPPKALPAGRTSEVDIQESSPTKPSQPSNSGI